jgi:ABC-type lipoprotein export system ATPase subunit
MVSHDPLVDQHAHQVLYLKDGDLVDTDSLKTSGLNENKLR